MKHLVWVILLVPIISFTQEEQKSTKVNLKLSWVDYWTKYDCIQDVLERNREEDKAVDIQIVIGEKSNKKRHKSRNKDQLKVEEKVLDEILTCHYTNYQSKIGYRSFEDQNFKEGDRILCPRIYFGFDGGERLREESKKSLQAILNFIQAHPKMIVEVGYYTSIRGNWSYNQQLSEYRLKSLDRALKTRLGLNTATNYILKGYGASSPIVPNYDLERVSSDRFIEELHKINERIELKILRIN